MYFGNKIVLQSVYALLYAAAAAGKSYLRDAESIHEICVKINTTVVRATPKKNNGKSHISNAFVIAVTFDQFFGKAIGLAIEIGYSYAQSPEA